MTTPNTRSSGRFSLAGDAALRLDLRGITRPLPGRASRICARDRRQTRMDTNTRQLAALVTRTFERFEAAVLTCLPADKRREIVLSPSSKYSSY